MNKQRALAFSLAATGAVIAMVIGLFIVPAIRDIRTLNEKIVQERVTVETRYFNRQRVRKTIENLTEIKMRLPDLRSIIVPSGGEEGLVEAIERLAEVNGIAEKLRLIPPQGGPQGYERKLIVEISASGDPRGIGKFLSDLERIDPVFVVTNMDIRGSDVTSKADALIAGWVSWPEKLPDAL